MNLQKILIPLAIIGAGVLAYRSYSWQGIAVVVSVLVFGILLHFSRMMQVLKRAANRPIGYVDSAVMLNAKLRVGHTLLHVVAMTKSLGVLTQTDMPQSSGLNVTEGMIGDQKVDLVHRTIWPEIYTWTDNGESRVTCTFFEGKLVNHVLLRPQNDEQP